MVDTKVSNRRLTEPGLKCPFPECDHVLDHVSIRLAVEDKQAITG
jgi:hypothetical protein